MKRSRFSQQPIETAVDASDDKLSGAETCMNPWNGKCLNTDISLYIMYKGSRLPICRKCWEAISSNDYEWMYD
jgi:hypothetical protein